MRACVKRAVVAAVLGCVLVSGASAQPVQKVLEVRIVGNKQMTIGAVSAHIRTRAGADYSEKVVRADEQRLLRTGRFLNVQATRTLTAQGVIVTFTVAERPLVATVLFRGNKAVKTGKLAAEVPFGSSDALNDYMVTAGKEAIEALYRKKGYYFIRVTVDANAMARTRQVIYQIVEGPKVAIRKIKYKGHSHFRAMTLRMKVGATARLWPFSAGTLDAEQIQRDVDTLRNLYAGEGFLDAEVGRELKFSPDKSRVVVTFIIREGPRYRISAVLFKGNTVFSGRELARRLKLQPGAFFDALALQRDIRRVEDTYGELGYIEAAVVARKVYKEKPGILDVVFEITEADKYKIGRVTIRGNDVTQDRVIRREFRFFPEQVFNTVAVEESRRRLLETRLFDSVTITPTGRKPGVRDVVVQVHEARTAEFLVGVGISSNSGLLGNIAFTQRNFDILKWPTSWKDLVSMQSWKGAGQVLRIVAEPGTELMRFRIEWFQPYLFDKRYSLGVKGFYWMRGRESYDEDRAGAVVSVGHRFKSRWYGEFSLRLESVRVDNLDSDAPPEVMAVSGPNTLLGLKGTLVRDRTDSRWMPARGDRILFSIEPVVGDHEFTVVSGDYRFYRTLWVDALDRKHVIATRASIGYIFGDAPVFEKFYGGGLGSLRGFEYRGIGPRSMGTDEPIGGDFFVFLGTEYRFPIFGQPGKGEVQGVVFLDTGTVESDFNIVTYRASVGVGVRWFIPMFGPIPISLDFGFPLSKDDQDDTQILTFSFGWRF